MKMNHYQEIAGSTAAYPDAIGPLYLGLKLAGEAGEVVEKLGKSLRNGTSSVVPYYAEEDRAMMMPLVKTIIDPLVADAIIMELGDVLWYVSKLAQELGYTLEMVAERNLDKVLDRRARGVVIGEGDNR